MLSKEEIEAEFNRAIKTDGERVYAEVLSLCGSACTAAHASNALTNIARSGQKLCSQLYEEVRALRKGLDEARRERADYRSREAANQAQIGDLVEHAEEAAAAECAETDYLLDCLADTTEKLVLALRENAVLKVKLERATGESA